MNYEKDNLKEIFELSQEREAQLAETLATATAKAQFNGTGMGPIMEALHGEAKTIEEALFIGFAAGALAEQLS